MHMTRECLHHLLRFIQAQQAVVDENAGELRTDRLVNERRCDRRIHAAGEAEDYLLAAYLFANLPDGLGYIVGHAPVAARAANFPHEALQDLRALPGVRDLRV